MVFAWQNGNRGVMSTKSEELFEEFLAAHQIRFSRIEEVKEKGESRPDYLVDLGASELIFEVKQLGDEEDAESLPPNVLWKGRPGAELRRRITRAKKQIQYGAVQNIASVLLVYNNTDPVFQMRGTDAFDFETAMYGDLTMFIDRETTQRSEFFHGRNNEMQESKNTSFSAVGHLCDRGGKTTVTLWENAHAKVKLPFTDLPACFKIKRVEIDKTPLSFR